MRHSRTPYSRARKVTISWRVGLLGVLAVLAVGVATATAATVTYPVADGWDSKQGKTLVQDGKLHQVQTSNNDWFQAEGGQSLVVRFAAAVPSGATIQSVRVAYDANADVVLGGHDHIYERYRPMTPTGASDPARGIREFVVGTGGRGHYALRADTRREAGSTGTLGVLRLTLRANGYDWRFLPVAGGTYNDNGSASCH